VFFGPEETYQLSNSWESYCISLEKLNKGANLQDVTSMFFLRADHHTDGKDIQLRNIYFTLP